MDIGKIIGVLFNLGLVLAGAGLLNLAVSSLRNELSNSKHHHMISLKQYNERLIQGR